MKIENNFCTREQAIRFKELGITQDGSFFVHRDSKNQTVFFYVPGTNMSEWINLQTGDKEENKYLERVMVRVFSVAELGEIITSDFYIRKAEATQWPEWFNKKWDFDGKGMFRIYSPMMLSDMIIYLLENKLLTAEEANKRLTYNF